ncbi:MAG: hypothetical protein NZM44_03585, partial [Candidatus Calescibacterium sp.]|nr:hypothetical protein [Candidatus Calescibacterium sp.]
MMDKKDEQKLKEDFFKAEEKILEILNTFEELIKVTQSYKTTADGLESIRKGLIDILKPLKAVVEDTSKVIEFVKNSEYFYGIKSGMENVQSGIERVDQKGVEIGELVKKVYGVLEDVLKRQGKMGQDVIDFSRNYEQKSDLLDNKVEEVKGLLQEQILESRDKLNDISDGIKRGIENVQSGIERVDQKGVEIGELLKKVYGV